MAIGDKYPDLITWPDTGLLALLNRQRDLSF